MLNTYDVPSERHSDLIHNNSLLLNSRLLFSIFLISSVEYNWWSHRDPYQNNTVIEQSRKPPSCPHPQISAWTLGNNWLSVPMHNGFFWAFSFPAAWVPFICWTSSSPRKHTTTPSAPQENSFPTECSDPVAVGCGYAIIPCRMCPWPVRRIISLWVKDGPKRVSWWEFLSALLQSPEDSPTYSWTFLQFWKEGVTCRKIGRYRFVCEILLYQAGLKDLFLKPPVSRPQMDTWSRFQRWPKQMPWLAEANENILRGWKTHPLRQPRIRSEWLFLSHTHTAF